MSGLGLELLLLLVAHLIHRRLNLEHLGRGCSDECSGGPRRQFIRRGGVEEDSAVAGGEPLAARAAARNAPLILIRTQTSLMKKVGKYLQ